MADPTKFTPSYDFSDYQAQNPVAPLPSQQVDIQFQQIKTTTDQTIEALKNVRRSDGALKNGIVTPESLAPSMSIGFTLRGNWVSGTEYVAGDGVAYDDIFYKALVSHTASDETRPDLDDEVWQFLTSFAAIVITDGSITPEKLSLQAEAFRDKIGALSSGAGVIGPPQLIDDPSGFRTKIGAVSAAESNVASQVHTAEDKGQPVDADEFGVWDSVSGLLRKITWSNIVAKLVGLFARKIDTTPNLFVNGSLIVSQENGTTLGTANGYFAADQFGMYINASGAAVSVQNIELANDDGGDRAIELKVTTAKASLGASDVWTLTQNIEGFRPQFKAARFGTAGAKPFVLRKRFWAPAAGTYSWHFQNQDGTRHCWVPFTISAGEAGTLVEKIIVVPPCTDGTWLKGEGQTGLICDLVLAAGATLVGGTAGVWGASAFYGGAGQKNCLDSTSNTMRAAELGLRLDPDATGVYGQYEVGETDAVFGPERYALKRLGVSFTVTRAGVNDQYVSIPFSMPMAKASPTSTISNVVDVDGGGSISSVTCRNWGIAIISMSALPGGNARYTFDALHLARLS